MLSRSRHADERASAAVEARRRQQLAAAGTREACPQARHLLLSIRPALRVCFSQGGRKKGSGPPGEQQNSHRSNGGAGDGAGTPRQGKGAGGKGGGGRNNDRRKQKPKAEEAAAPAAPAAPAVVVDVSDAAPIVQEKPKEKPKEKTKEKPAEKPTAPVVPAAVAPAAAESKEGGGELEKKLRALRKKLKAIDDLAEKQAAGVELNADQLSKIAARGQIESEITRWQAFGDADELDKEIKKLGKKIRQVRASEEQAPRVANPVRPGLR